MTAEIEQYRHRDLAVAQPSPVPGQGVGRIVEWAESAQAAHRVAETLCKTSFVPEVFRGKPFEATAAILTGSEVGLSPMASLQAFDVIQGRAAARAITQRAVAQSRGHEMVLVESTDSRCVMEGRRRGDERWQRIVWTIDRARKLQLLEKPNWKNQPQAMLLARATGELARLIASDALMGIPYNVEELQDQDDAPAPAGGTRAVKRRAPVAQLPTPEPAQVDGPPLPGEDEPVDADPEPPADPITASQMKALHASLKDAGITDRDKALEFFEDTTGRWVESSKDLTKAEASQVIDALKNPPAADADAELDPTLDADWQGGESR